MLIGEVLIKFSDAEGKKTQEDYHQENLIYEQTLIDILNYFPIAFFGEFFGFATGARVVISTQNIPPDPNDNILTGMIAVGDNIPGEVSPVWFEDITPNFGQIVNQFPAPGFSRTFDSVGLTLRPPNNNVVPPDDNQPALTTVLLTIPCTQNASEILTIFYFIKVIDNYRKFFNARFLKDFGGSIFGIKQCRLDYLSANYGSVPTQPYENLYFPESVRLISAPPVTPSWDTGATIADHFKWKQTKEFTIANSGIPGQTDQEIGRIFNSFLVGKSNDREPKEISSPNINYIKGSGATSEFTESAYRMQRYRPRQVSMSVGYTARIPPFQPAWGHRPGGTKPFFEPLYKERGNGAFSIAGTWVTDMPSMYRIEITKDGSVGTSEYKFSKRYHVGFEGNTWTNRLNAIAFRNPNISAAPGLHGWKTEDNDLLRFSNTKIVQYDATGLTLLDLLTGAYTNFDVDSTPALPVTTLRQCAVDVTNKLIYAACRDTGLYVIDVTANTVTQIKTAPCYGVDIGVSNIAYGLFEGSLNNSSNWTVDLPISFTGLTDSNWSKCFFIKCNPSNVDKQIGLIIKTPGDDTSRTIVWYSDNLNTTNQGYSGSDLYQFPASFDVSDVDDFWANTAGKSFYFDSTSFDNISSITPYINSFVHSVWGTIPVFGKVTFYKKYLVAYNKLVDKAGIEIPGTPIIETYGTCVHLCGGIVCLGSWLLCLLPYDDAWTSYGWDATNWIDGNTSSKVTHATAQALIDGLTIIFSNGATAPQFLNGDFYTQSINLGTLKDNSIAIYYENFWYTKKVNFDTPVNIPITATTETFPEQSNIYWIRLETDSIDALSEFLINGTNVLKVWVDGTAPNANEITIDGIAGVITFNSADIGKTLTGFYAWIENYY